MTLFEVHIIVVNKIVQIYLRYICLNVNAQRRRVVYSIVT
jgi:hypothetical protein